MCGPARALPYELNVRGTVDTVHNTLNLEFINSGEATVVFQVRRADASAAVRNYTVEPGKRLADKWSIYSTYDVSVYGPNGFVRYFKGSVGSKASIVQVHASYGTQDGGELRWSIRNLGEHKATVSVLDAYTGNQVNRALGEDAEFSDNWGCDALHGWYDLIVTVAEDPTFKYRLAGHIETGRDSFSDPSAGWFDLKRLAMTSGPAQEFALWLQRANDPSATEEERSQCRVLMERHLQERMRQAFKAAGAAANGWRNET